MPGRNPGRLVIVAPTAPLAEPDPMPSPRALLFDLDGVLVRSGEPWLRTMQEASRAFHGKPVSRADFNRTFGQSAEADVAQFELRCTAEELNRFYAEVFPRFASLSRVDPGAQGVLAHLRDRGIKRAVVTNTVSPLAFDILRSTALFDLFDWVACADHVERSKPAPDMVLHAAQKLGVAPERAWMVGDSRYDREAARAAGVRFLGLGLEGDPRIERLEEVIALVGGA
jgi:phosphoglycolate phosphatase/AHBA synthesis associated protein